MEMDDKTNGHSSPEKKAEEGEKPNSATDPILNITGAFGTYQFWLCILVFIGKFPIAFHQIAIVFLAPKVSFTCDGVPNKCPCSNPVYNATVFTRTITMQWDLICEDAWMNSFNQTLFQLGTLIGSVLFGMASDRFGRKNPCIVSCVIQIVSSILAAFMNNYWLFTLCRFLTGVSVGGTMVTGFVVVMEFVGAKYRDVLSALYQVPFNLGHMLLPLISYYLRDYVQFQLAISIPTIALISYVCLLPETPRWLIATKQTDRAIGILERVATVNNRPTSNVKRDVQDFQAAVEKNKLTKGTLADLFRTPNMRKNICIMAYNWFTCSYCFYGLSQYVGQLTGNIFVNVAISATVTLIGTLLTIPLMKLLGRKTILIVFNIICGVCLIILIFMPPGLGVVILASCGVVSAFAVFVLVYLYGSELFPTVVRNNAIGFCSMMARVGSMIAPFINDLNAYAVWAPPIAFAVVPLLAAFLTFFIPETKGIVMMTTLEEGERFGKKVVEQPKSGVCSYL